MTSSAAGSVSSVPPLGSSFTIPEFIQQTDSQVAQVKAVLGKIRVQEDIPIQAPLNELFSIVHSLCEYLKVTYDHVLSERQKFTENQVKSDEKIALLIEEVDKLKN